MDQNLALKSLKKLSTGLDKNHAGKFFLSDGTLLGYIRDKNFIPGDNDIDIGLWIEDYSDTLLQDLSDVGIAHIATKGDIKNGLQLKFRDGEIPIDLYFYYREKDHIWTTINPRPGRRLLITYPTFDLEEANFLSVKVMVPSPPKKYLEASYGSKWQHRVRKWNYKYVQQNIEETGTPIWRFIHPIKRAYWNWRNPDIYLPMKQKTVFTDGVFDLFHANHLALLKEAKANGNKLVVGVLSDAVVRGYKRAPVIAEAERLAIVENIACVDTAFIVDKPLVSQTMDDIVEEHGIDAVVYAGNSTPEFYESAEKAGIMVRLPYHTGVSTTGIIENIRQDKPDAE